MEGLQDIAAYWNQHQREKEEIGMSLLAIVAAVLSIIGSAFGITVNGSKIRRWIHRKLGRKK
jgi:hypothetical protein